jgi:hypothetical protein
MQLVADVQDTPVMNPSSPSLGVAIVCSDQALPFHRSATAPKTGAVVDPTAVHAAAAEHDTADRTVKGASGIAGVGTMLQLTPSHRSASATVNPAALLVAPTAMHALALTHDTPASEPPRPTGEA